MAVLTADAYMPHEGDANKSTVIAAGALTFYKGAIVWGLAAGGASDAPASGDRILGICAAQTTTTAAGDYVEVYTSGTFSMPAMTNVTDADLGDLIVFDAGITITDNAADCVAAGDITLAASDAVLGRLVRYENSRPVVQITGLVGLIYDATAAAFK